MVATDRTFKSMGPIGGLRKAVEINGCKIGMGWEICTAWEKAAI